MLQHVPAREQALANMVAATKPGGWVVIEDVDWLVFDAQDLPEPFATLHRTVRAGLRATPPATTVTGVGGCCGRCRDAGLVDVESRGTVVTMHGGTPGAEWYVLALERAGPRLVADGLLGADLVEAALAQAREPDFAVLGPARHQRLGSPPGLIGR